MDLLCIYIKNNNILPKVILFVILLNNYNYKLLPNWLYLLV